MIQGGCGLDLQVEIHSNVRSFPNIKLLVLAEHGGARL